MRLLVVSHTPHHRRDGDVVGWGATVRELDHLATLFDQVVHIAPLHDGPAPANALPYTSRTRLVAVAPAGGARPSDKIAAALRLPQYARTIQRYARDADVVHVRCPASIAIAALLVLARQRDGATRWVKFAGEWQRRPDEPLSYRLQRWWLRRGYARATVTVNGRAPGDPPHVRSLTNPTLTTHEIAAGRAAAARKSPSSPLRLVFAGRLDEHKGFSIALQVVQGIAAEHHRVRLDVLGDGDARAEYEERSRSIGADIRFHGWVSPDDVRERLASAHFLLLPSRSEGFPKVVAEAFAYGVVPLASAVSQLPAVLAEVGSGVAVPADEPATFVASVRAYLDDPGRWERERDAGVAAAEGYSYDRYLTEVASLLGLPPSAATSPDRPTSA